jgi:predicted DNA-binding antitoxin AbrB/MazE fold protein
MAQQIHAIYENGVLRPLEPLNLSEQQRVRISINGVIADSEDVVARLLIRRLHMRTTRPADKGGEGSQA